MSDAEFTTSKESDHAALELRAEYEPDDERAARALLLIMGFSADEIERVVGELSLESPQEM